MKFSNNREEDVSINLAPLIDVVFLLLIFFMVSTTFEKESQLRIRLPQASITEQSIAKNNVLVVEISSRGDYALKGPDDSRTYPLINRAPDTLRRGIMETVGVRDDVIVVIRADRATSHEAVIQALDAVRRSNIREITFSTQQKKTN